MGILQEGGAHFIAVLIEGIQEFRACLKIEREIWQQYGQYSGPQPPFATVKLHMVADRRENSLFQSRIHKYSRSRGSLVQIFSAQIQFRYCKRDASQQLDRVDEASSGSDSECLA